ncbi:MAG: hypothetical protein M1826_004706 [Phylliscum demangeonii]|nr:MAG: hypothetical protein M1826_004706 [Phylliscum demangeonii]
MGKPVQVAPAPAPLHTPIPSPSSASKPPPPPTLTEAQQAKYEQLLLTVSSWATIPSDAAKNAPTAPVTDDERMWLSRECLLRYLRATKWNAVEAPKRLLATLVWRREYGVEKLTAEYISPEAETGKQVVLGFDNSARPCLYLRPSQQNTKRSDRQIEHLVFMMERVIDLMVPDQDTMALLIDFGDSSNSSIPSVSQGRQTLNILQGHYPERLGRSLIINVPWAVWGFFKLISPFIDPLTREKMKFNEDLRRHVPPEQLWTMMGGELHFQYDHATYWPALNKLAAERKAIYRERWIRAGKKIGESEEYLKGGGAGTTSSLETLSTEPGPAPNAAAANLEKEQVIFNGGSDLAPSGPVEATA